MSVWRVRMQAVIDDEFEVEADSEEEAVANAERDWTFTEASQWETDVEKVET